MKNFLKRLDFKFHAITFLPLFFLLLTYPAMKFLPVEYAYENSLLENIQLIVLLILFAVCAKARVDRNFFNSLAFVVIILFLREINCGRTVFFPIEGMENAFYSWKDIKYGYLAEPLYCCFIAFSALYFLMSKSYKVLFRYITKAKISVYNWIFLLTGVILGTIGEKTHNFTLEEMTETVFYLSLLAIIFLQARNEDYIEESYY